MSFTAIAEPAQRRMDEMGALRTDYLWWSFHWYQNSALCATYLGVGPDMSVSGRSAAEVRQQIERIETRRSSELARLRAEFPAATVWMSECGKLYAIPAAAQSGSSLIPVLEADTARELRRLAGIGQ